MERKLSRRDFLRTAALGGLGLATAPILAACAPQQPAPAAPAATTAPAKSPTEAPKQAPAAAQPVEISYLVRTDLGEAMTKCDDEMIKDFQAKNPNIKVNKVGVAWGDYNAKLLAMFAGGTAPEVSVGYAAGFVTFFDNKAVQPIDEYVRNDKLDLSFLDKVATQIVTREGKLWGMPVEMIPYVTFYRPDLFEKAGLPRPPADWNDKSWTLDRAFEAATKIAKDTGDPTKAVYGIYMFVQQLGNIAWLWGADPFNDQGGPELSDCYKTGKVTKAFYTQDKIVECFQYLVDLTYKHKISPKPSDTAAIQQAAGWPFLSGRIGMWLDGEWNTTSLLNSKLTDWKYAMAAYPYGPRGHNTDPAGDNAWFLGAKCKQPDAAWKFIRYVGLEEGAVIHAKLSGFMPANPKVANHYYDAIMKGPIDMSRADLEKVCSGALEYGFPMPGKTLSGFAELTKVFTQTTATIWSGEKPVKDGLADCQKAFEQLIKTSV